MGQSMKRAVPFLIAMLLLALPVYGSAGQVLPEIDSYEVKFLLDPQKALADNHMLTEEIQRQFRVEEECTAIDVIYLETADRAFDREGWVNRIRWKRGKKKPEHTCKKRYTVAGMEPEDILMALENAVSDGMEVLSDDCSAEIDWGYSQMTLSLTWESSVKYKDYQSLRQFSTEDAIAYFAASMPEEEIDWKRKGWGRETLARAQKAGIATFLRYKGAWEGTSVTFDTVAIPGNGAGEYIVELSFKADDYAQAAEIRRRLTVFLDTAGILRKADFLKTQRILDAYLRE